MTLQTFTGTLKFKLIATAVLSASAGAGGGILVFAKLQEKKFQERLTKEIEQSKVYYQQMYSTPVFEKEEKPENPPEEELLGQIRISTQEHDGVPIDVVGDALSAVTRYQGEKDEADAKEREPEVINLFQSNVPPGDEVLAALMADRDPAQPYIITKKEYWENEPDHEQIPFTYWTGDGILVDDREEFNPIDDVERVAGEENLLHFGYGSEDENLLYIRNEAVSPPYDLCVTRSTGKYAVEVIGELSEDDNHIEHSHGRKFRLHRDE